MGFLSSLLSSKPKSAKKCLSCGKERLPGVKIPACLRCNDGVCAECSRDGICPRCRHQHESEARVDQTVAETEEFYSASNDQAQLASCGRCSRKDTDLLPCMSCEKLCCTSCADAVFVSPFRRCRLCPSPIGGELAFVAKAFEKQNQMLREKELSEKRAATMKQLNQHVVPTEERAILWIAEVAKTDPASVRSVTPYEYRLPIEEECSVCRVLLPSSKEADEQRGCCMQCCRTICENCSYDSSNCVLGQLLCDKCKGRVYNPKDVDRASYFSHALQPELAHSGLGIAVGSSAAALFAVNAFTSSVNSHVLLPPLLPSDSKVSTLPGEEKSSIPCSDVNAEGQKVVLATGTYGASLSIAGNASVEYSRFNPCPFSTDITCPDATHSILLSYGREGFETEALLRTIIRDPALYLALIATDDSNSNGKSTKKEKVDKKKLAKLEKKHSLDVDAFENRFICECEVLAKRAMHSKFSMLSRLQIFNHSGLMKIRSVQEKSDDSHWHHVSSLLGVERADISVVSNYLNQVSNLKDRSSLPIVASSTVSIQSALGEAADLKQLIESQREPFPEAVVVSLSLQIAEALQYLHTSGTGSESTFKAYAAKGGITKDAARPLVHGAVSPKNIMLCESYRVVLMQPSTMWSTVPPAHKVAASTQTLHSLVQLLLSKVAPDGVIDTTQVKELSEKLDDGLAAPFILEMLDKMNATRRDGPPAETEEELTPQHTTPTTEYLEKLRLTTMTRREKIALRTGLSTAATTQKLADFVVRGSKIVKCDPYNPHTWMESSSSESSQEDAISEGDSTDNSIQNKDVGEPDSSTTPSNNSSFDSTTDIRELRRKYLATNPYGKYDDGESDFDGSHLSSEKDDASGGSDNGSVDHVPHEISIPEVHVPQQDHVPGYYSEAPEEVLIEYIAPEMRAGRGCPKSDVWSLGVVMLVLAALPEFPLLGMEGTLVDIGSTMWTKDRLASAIDATILENCRTYSPILLTLITQMLQPNVDDRPSSTDVVRVLRGMSTSLDMNRVD